MNKLFGTLNKKDVFLWMMSLLTVMICNLLTPTKDTVTLLATLIGVTALIFVAKGDVLGQILTFIFAILYSVTAFKFRYWGEILTYMGMSAPIAALSAISWLRNPYKKGIREVKIKHIGIKGYVILTVLTVAVTLLFGAVLYFFDTPNLFFSTLSTSTSFLASSLMFLRNSNYALAYAANDIVLIVLWILASAEDIVYVPMVACFIIFLINDIYGYICWRKREIKQSTPE
ncbi:MAG: nicotinamide mononucleotide transporter [Ruminococcaceae bacterium]|nr:nicotinamide mononucleotide transporter [Oscillospiraceae bacterium]